MKKLYLAFISLCLIPIAGRSQDNTNFSEKAPNAGNIKTLLKSTSFDLEDNLKSASASWELQLSATCAIADGEAGIETDGKYIYVTKWNGSELYRYNMDGTFVSAFTIAGVAYVRDLAYDGEYFYGAAANTIVFKMDFTEGAETLVGTINAPVAVRAIAYNDDLDAFYANNWSTDITLFNRSGSIISQGSCTNWDSYYGFAYDNLSEGGPYLWAFSQSGSGSVIVQLNAATYTETGFTFDVNTNLGTTEIAGGLFTSDKIVNGTFSIGGLVQNDKIFAYKLADYYAACQDAIIRLDADGSASTTVADIDNGSNSIYGIASLTLSKTDFTCADVGENTVILTLVDSSSNTATCNAIVTVLDTIAPVTICQEATIYLDSTGNASIDSSFIDNGSYDVCGIATMVPDVTSFTCGDVGDNTVHMTVTDGSGNSSSDSSTVTVIDTIAPVTICQEATIYLDSTGNASIDSSFIDNGSYDACGIAAMALDVTNFDCTNIGDNKVHLTVTDVNGNSSADSSMVTVLDTIAPVALCQNINIDLDNEGNATITADQIDNGSYDVCGIQSLSIDKSTFTGSDLGNNTVVLMVTDNNGNSSTCNSTVRVSDRYSPGVQCNTKDFVLPSNGIYELTEADIYKLSKGTIDNVDDYDDLTISVSPSTLTCEHIGGTTIRVYASDNSGNGSYCTVEVGVTAGDSEPTIDSIYDVSTNEDVPVSVALSGISDGSACFEKDITVTASNDNSNLISNITVNHSTYDETATLDIDLVANQSGSSRVTVVVEDNEGAITSESFTLDVTPVNDAPILVHSLSDQSVKANESLELTLSKLLGILFNDIDDSTLFFDIHTTNGLLPEWITTSDSADMVIINIEPMQTDTGYYDIVVEAMDMSGATAADTFGLSVNKLLTGVTGIYNSDMEFNLYPNPSHGQVNIKLSTLFAGEAELVVMNMAGQQVYHKTYLPTSNITLDLGNNASGTYMVILKAENKVMIKKVVLDKN